MGLLDFFKRSKTHGDDDSTATNKNVARLGRVAAHKRAQNYDRMEAIQNLSSVGTADSAAALLKRFTFYIEPSITDQEEKDVAFRGILAAGAAAVEPIREFCVRAESLTWPMKLLEQLLDKDAYVDELLVLLGRFDTDYTKNVEPKVQLIAALEDKQRDDVRQAVEPFLQDANEPARFHAVATVFSQEQPAAAEALCQALVEEESVRIKNRICDGLSSRGWAIPDGLQDEVRKVLPAGFHLDGGKLRGGGQ
jgi:HEAT repeat protein